MPGTSTYFTEVTLGRKLKETQELGMLKYGSKQEEQDDFQNYILFSGFKVSCFQHPGLAFWLCHLRGSQYVDEIHV